MEIIEQIAIGFLILITLIIIANWIILPITIEKGFDKIAEEIKNHK